MGRPRQPDQADTNRYASHDSFHLSDREEEVLHNFALWAIGRRLRDIHSPVVPRFSHIPSRINHRIGQQKYFAPSVCSSQSIRQPLVIKPSLSRPNSQNNIHPPMFAHPKDEQFRFAPQNFTANSNWQRSTNIQQLPPFQLSECGPHCGCRQNIPSAHAHPEMSESLLNHAYYSPQSSQQSFPNNINLPHINGQMAFGRIRRSGAM